MAQLPLLPKGPLTAAAARLLQADLPPAPDAAAVLADLLDLRGGVSLADALAELPPPGGVLPASADAAALTVLVQDEVAALDARLREACENAFRPRYRLPGPARAHALLEQAGAFAPRRTPRTAATAARTLWAPYGDFLETHLKRARFGLRDLRRAVTPRLHALGPAAERLERLEAALAIATGPEVERLYRRGLLRLETCFLDGLKNALKALPKTPGSPPAGAVEAWYEPGGFVAEVFDDGRRFAQALFAHERDHLEALIRAAAGA